MCPLTCQFDISSYTFLFVGQARSNFLSLGKTFAYTPLTERRLAKTSEKILKKKGVRSEDTLDIM
jgi:hypothetical protein